MGRLYGLIVFVQILLMTYTYFFVRRVLRFYGVDVHKWYGLLLPAIPALILFSVSGSIWNTGFLISMHLVGLSLVTDIAAFIARHLFRHAQSAAVYRFGHMVYRCGVLPFLLTAVVMLYGYYNMNHIIRTDYTVKTEKAVSEYTVVLLSDIHFGTIQPKKLLKEKAAEISALNPDIVILCGDIVEEGTSRESMSEVFEILGNIPTRYGVYYVFGNHDRQTYKANKTYTTQELEEEIAGHGIRILCDERVEIAGEITLAGREDARWGNTAKRMSADSLLSGVDTKTFVIVADHQPIEYRECAESGADLELSGHTHAGQIWPVGIFTTLSGNLNYGLYHREGIDVIVSSGIAGWGYPVRTGEHCEYVVVHIVPEAK